jgi:hypothetical protein
MSTPFKLATRDLIFDSSASPPAAATTLFIPFRLLLFQVYAKEVQRRYIPFYFNSSPDLISGVLTFNLKTFSCLPAFVTRILLFLH